MGITVKVYLNAGKPDEEIRRFVADEYAMKSFSVIRDRIAFIFPSLAEQDFSITWTDSEGDRIVMSSDEELFDALANVKENILKVYIVSSSPQDIEQSQSFERIHSNVVCNSCSGTVQGSRFRCLQCDDYNLCATCHNKDVHSHHDMLKMVNPDSKPPWCPQNTCHSRKYSKCKASAGHGCCQQGNVNQARDVEELKKDYLRNIGKDVASMLTSVGVNVAIDIENSDGEREPLKVDSISRSVADCLPSVSRPAGEENSCSKKSSPNTRESLKRTPFTTSVQSSSSQTDCSKSSSSGQGDTVNAMGLRRNFSSPCSSSNASQPCNMSQDKSTEQDDIACKTDAAKPTCSGTKIRGALEQMLEMGYTDEGGWLSQLLEANNGDIVAVLESLHPSK